jgi:ABC-type phosphate transport system substrate-binding protein
MRAVVLVVAGLGLAAAAAASPAEPAADAYRIVVHPSNPATRFERRFVEDAFLKKVKTWPNGELIRPVDQPPGAPIRRRFSAEVLKRPVAAVNAYWQQRIFSGRDVPPPALDGDEEVIRYISGHSGAVGYVSASSATAGVKTVPISF